MLKKVRRQRSATQLEALQHDSYIKQVLTELLDRETETSEERAARVERIKRQVAAGEYEIKSEAVAVALIY